MSKTEIAFAMGQHCEDMDDAPSEEESHKYVSRIMNPCYDTCQTGDKAENKKEKRNTRFIEEYMECPPRSSPEHRMSRRERVIREVINERREARHALWSWADREEMVDNPVDRKCAHNVPKEIKSDMLWPIIFHRYSVEPEAYQEKSEKDRL